MRLGEPRSCDIPNSLPAINHSQCQLRYANKLMRDVQEVRDRVFYCQFREVERWGNLHRTKASGRGISNGFDKCDFDLALTMIFPDIRIYRFCLDAGGRREVIHAPRECQNVTILTTGIAHVPYVLQYTLSGYHLYAISVGRLWSIPFRPSNKPGPHPRAFPRIFSQKDGLH
jgi:hypothetical protein